MGSNEQVNSPVARVASLRLRILAPARAHLRVSNNPRVFTVEENVLQILVFKIGALQHILQIRFGEA